MAKRKKGKPKKRKSRKRPTQKTYLKKAALGLCILLFLVVAAGFVAHYVFEPELPPAKKLQVNKRSIHKPPVFEIYPKEKTPSLQPIAKPKTPLPHNRPIVAIIIDDLGYDRILVERFLGIDAIFSFSVLPYSPFQNKIIRAIRAKGFETMLHLPMEPFEYPAVDPGPGALLTSMTPDQLIRQLNKNLDAFPFIKGVNNHMGSKMTTNSPQLYQIFSVLKKRGLFFIDSRTTAKSLCRPSARLLQLPFAERSVFIDHIQKPDFIRKQIRRLIRIAIREGVAIGIAHPHTLTYNILREAIPDLQTEVRLVPASQVINKVG